MNRASSDATPKDRPPVQFDGMRDDDGNEPFPFSWETLVARLVHPMRVAIVEALAYIGRPLSATDLRKVFDQEHEVSFISYHVVQLAKVGAVVKVSERHVRGAVKKSYFFPPPE